MSVNLWRKFVIPRLKDCCDIGEERKRPGGKTAVITVDGVRCYFKYTNLGRSGSYRTTFPGEYVKSLLPGDFKHTCLCWVCGDSYPEWLYVVPRWILADFLQRKKQCWRRKKTSGWYESKICDCRLEISSHELFGIGERRDPLDLLPYAVKVRSELDDEDLVALLSAVHRFNTEDISDDEEFDPVDETQEAETKNVSQRARRKGFREAILEAYSGQCAVCGISITDRDGNSGIQAAHIWPKRLGGRDKTRNGIALCPQHHWAFDAHWFTIDRDYRITVSPSLPVSDDYKFIAECASRRIKLPSDRRFWPDQNKALDRHRKQMQMSSA